VDEGCGETFYVVGMGSGKSRRLASPVGQRGVEAGGGRVELERFKRPPEKEIQKVLRVSAERRRWWLILFCCAVIN